MSGSPFTLVPFGDGTHSKPYTPIGAHLASTLPPCPPHTLHHPDGTVESVETDDQVYFSDI